MTSPRFFFEIRLLTILDDRFLATLKHAKLRVKKLTVRVQCYLKSNLIRVEDNENKCAKGKN